MEKLTDLEKDFLLRAILYVSKPYELIPKLRALLPVQTHKLMRDYYPTGESENEPIGTIVRRTMGKVNV